MTKLKKVVFILSFILSLNSYADLVLHHNEGSASIGKFDLKVISINGKICFEKNNVSAFIPQLTIKTSELAKCGDDELYRVYGIIKSWFYGHKVYYSNRFVNKNSECNINHNKDGYFSTKLGIICEE